MSLYLGSNLVNIGSQEWARPSDWLPRPPITGSQQFWGLLAVYPTDSNYIAASATNGYYINWGDGSPTLNYTSSQTAEYSHSYNSLPSESYCSRGYRQAWVNIVPSGSGVDLVTINLQRKHTKTGLPTVPTAAWLDIYVTGSTITTCTIGGVVVDNHLFENCNLDIGKLTNVSSMFRGCNVLHAIPMVDTSGISNFASIFQSCNAITTIPKLNTSSGSNFTYMFNGCTNLKTIPLIDTSNGTDFTSMFQACINLPTIPPLNTSSGSNFTSMFSGCSNLKTIPLIDTSLGSNFTSTFQACSNLKTIPLIDTSNVTKLVTTFYLCSNLQTIPLLDTSKVFDFSSMFNACSALTYVPPLNTSSGSNFGSMFSTDTSLRVGALSGSTRTIDYSSLNLSRNAIVSIFNNLGTAALTQSISCSLNVGTPDLTAADIQIATDKGWLVKTT